MFISSEGGCGRLAVKPRSCFFLFWKQRCISISTYILWTSSKSFYVSAAYLSKTIKRWSEDHEDNCFFHYVFIDNTRRTTSRVAEMVTCCLSRSTITVSLLWSFTDVLSLLSLFYVLFYVVLKEIRNTVKKEVRQLLFLKSFYFPLSICHL